MKTFVVGERVLLFTTGSSGTVLTWQAAKEGTHSGYVVIEVDGSGPKIMYTCDFVDLLPLNKKNQKLAAKFSKIRDCFAAKHARNSEKLRNFRARLEKSEEAWEATRIKLEDEEYAAYKALLKEAENVS